MSLLKCKFIIGISCAVTLLSSYLIVSEQRREMHLANPFLESFSTRCPGVLKAGCRAGWDAPRLWHSSFSGCSLWQQHHRQRLNSICHLCRMVRGNVAVDHEECAVAQDGGLQTPPGVRMTLGPCCAGLRSEKRGFFEFCCLNTVLLTGLLKPFSLLEAACF